MQLAIIITQKVTRDTTHHLHFSMFQNVLLQHKRKQQTLTPLADSTFNNCMAQSGPLAKGKDCQFV